MNTMERPSVGKGSRMEDTCEPQTLEMQEEVGSCTGPD